MVNPDFPPTRLLNRRLIRLSGSDAVTLLDGLLTQNIASLKEKDITYGALLTPQGKVLSAMLIYKADGDIILETAASEQETILKRLMMYKLRADVTLSAESALGVAASPDALDDAVLSLPDPRSPALGFRSLIDQDHPLAEDRMAYDIARYAAGVAEGDDIEREKDFWLETAAEKLNGVSFSKGCYVGQELTARMKHRTSVKKLILPLTVEAEGPKVGDEIINADEKPVGTIRALEGQVGLAFVRLERATGALTSNGIPVHINLPEPKPEAD